MKLILTQAVEHLGEAGDVVNVKAGFGRNYLLPQGLAYAASAANMKRIEEEQSRAADRAKRDYLEAKRRASQLDGMVLEFKANAGEEGKLFGSITTGDIAEELGTRDLDFDVDRRRIQLDEPIKSVGVYNVALRLHSEVDATFEVRVEPENPS